MLRRLFRIDEIKEYRSKSKSGCVVLLYSLFYSPEY